jgi:hypothetical protein
MIDKLLKHKDDHEMNKDDHEHAVNNLGEILEDGVDGGLAPPLLRPGVGPGVRHPAPGSLF